MIDTGYEKNRQTRIKQEGPSGKENSDMRIISSLICSVRWNNLEFCRKSRKIRETAQI